jgi:glc operon protein GlcG
VAERLTFLSLSRYMPIQGGLPIKIGGECLGGIGVSGVQSENDEKIAEAGLAALG